MNKKLNKILLLMFLTISFLELFSHSNVVKEAIINSSKLWFYNLVPSILPIYLFIDISLNYNYFKYIDIILYPLLNKLFNIKKNISYIFILSILSGFPSNSKYLKNALDNNLINIKEANRLLTFTHFSNPLFIIESIGINFLNNKKIGIIILISHYLGNILLGIINRNSYIDISNNSINRQKNTFINTLSNSITNTFSILILLYGIITFFMVITSLLNVNININPIINGLICGLLEITNGISLVSNLSIPIIYKGIIITFLLSFGGLCIHMQVFSILKEYSLKYSSYLKYRIIHGIVSSCIFYCIYVSIAK